MRITAINRRIGIEEPPPLLAGRLAENLFGWAAPPAGKRSPASGLIVVIVAGAAALVSVLS